MHKPPNIVPDCPKKGKPVPKSIYATPAPSKRMTVNSLSSGYDTYFHGQKVDNLLARYGEELVREGVRIPCDIGDFVPEMQKLIDNEKLPPFEQLLSALLDPSFDAFAFPEPVHCYESISDTTQ